MYKRTVLIVDDQEINRRILGKILSKDYEIMEAENGKIAMDLLRDNVELISAVLLDIVMPVMDGYEVLEEVSKDEHLSHIPIIVSSMKDGDEAELKALSMGALDFISKPYKPAIIQRRLSNLINMRETAATINRTEKDQLTGLYNKEFFISKAEDLLKQNKDQTYDILCFGIERFKLVNDTYGTKKGDDVLKFFASLLVEAGDKDKICGRFNADHFFVMTKHKGVYPDSFFQIWKDKLRHGPVDIDLKVNCGIYVITDKELEVDLMCDRAQLAANNNSKRYDQIYSYYDDSIRQKMLNEQFIVSSMQSAIDNEEFKVYYQPKYDLNSEMIAGAEALVRWINPEKGFMSPGDFVPVFEENGFITQLDHYVLERTCKDIRSWMDAGNKPVAVSINVSRADVYNPKLVDILLGLIGKYNIPMRYLHLEITESAYTENPDQIIDVINQLRDSGFVIEMDDFGSGYSSLNMLAEMPVDILKLDMRFIQKEAQYSSVRGILSFIISLAKWMNLSVIAEGVETAEQIMLLRSMDCNYVQGFYYAKPMPEPDFRALMESSNVVEMSYPVKKAVDYVSENKLKGKEDGRVMLIVDDVEINRATIASAFADRYVIVEAENGLEAKEFLEESWQKVEVIMLDLLMPVMDGFQLLKMIRNDDNMKYIPVLITSQGDAANEKRALEMQADDFVSKPYDVDIIRHRVANVVGNHELKMIKDGLMTADSINENLFEDIESVEMNLTRNIDVLKKYFDIVRLVDPEKTLVLESNCDDTCDELSCFSVWGKSTRCNNCTSMKAYENKSRESKLEYSSDGLFFVISQYVPYGEFGAILEMVTKLKSDYVDNVFDKDMLYVSLDELNDRLERDELTGVYNRRHIDKYLKRYLESANAKKNNIGIAMIDVDNFKSINDKEGHLVGDSALKMVADVLQENIAHNRGDFVARFGGDEFMVVCRNISPEVFEKRIRTVIKLIPYVIVEDGKNMEISISAGCVNTEEEPDADYRKLIDIADHRLYRAKALGRNCLVFED